MYAHGVRRYTVPSRNCDYPPLVRGVSNCAQHLRDGTVSVRRGQSAIVPSSAEARDCRSPRLASPLFTNTQFHGHQRSSSIRREAPRAQNSISAWPHVCVRESLNMGPRAPRQLTARQEHPKGTFCPLSWTQCMAPCNHGTCFPRGGISHLLNA